MDNKQFCTASSAVSQAAASIGVLKRIDHGKSNSSEAGCTRASAGPYVSGSAVHRREERAAVQHAHHDPFVCMGVLGRSPQVEP